MQTLSRQILPAASPSAAYRLIPQPFASRAAGSRVRHGLQRVSSTATVPTWSLIEQQAGTEVLEGYVLRPGQSPASSPHTALPTERHVETASPVVLYRDTNAWCPSCERVWMVLLEKQIDFAVVFIQLYNKPEWYKELVPTTLVPAVDIRHGAQSRGIVYESFDILKALDEEFPERPLFPSDLSVAAEGERLCALSDQLSKSGYKFLLGRGGGSEGSKADETLVPGFRAEFEDLLQQADEALGKHSGGPFFLGDFSYVDAMFLPSLERFAANMPFVRGLHLKGRPELPRLDAWFHALDARPTYQQVKTDDKTHHLLTQKFFSPLTTHPPPPIENVVHRARREAAAKMNANRAIIVQDCTNNSGIFSTQHRGINGNPPQPTPEVSHAVDFALRQVANCLLSGDVGPKHPEARSRSIVAAVVAYWRNRASTPRDMSAAAAEEMRAACDHVLQETY